MISAEIISLCCREGALYANLVSITARRDALTEHTGWGGYNHLENRMLLKQMEALQDELDVVKQSIRDYEDEGGTQ